MLNKIVFSLVVMMLPAAAFSGELRELPGGIRVYNGMLAAPKKAVVVAPDPCASLRRTIGVIKLSILALSTEESTTCGVTCVGLLEELGRLEAELSLCEAGQSAVLPQR